MYGDNEPHRTPRQVEGRKADPQTDPDDIVAEPDKAEDRVLARLLTCAEACLEHVRRVHWGIATSQYQAGDGNYILDVHIEVKCFRTKDKTDG